MTALREANQVGNLQPTTLVSYDADIESGFRQPGRAALRAEGMDAAALADTHLARPDESDGGSRNTNICAKT